MFVLTHPTVKKVSFALSVFFIFLTNPYADAQDVLPKFGKIDTADLLMKQCPFDNSADAMNLVDYQRAKFELAQGGYYADIERWVRVKIFKPGGFKYASIIIPYLSKERLTTVKDIEAFTYNIDSNGNVVTENVGRKEMFKEKSKEGTGSIRFAFADVKPGTVVEYRYILQENNFMFLEPWVFQDVIPTRLSVCNLKYDGNISVSTRLHTSFTFETDQDTVKAPDGYYKKITFYYLMRDVPAFRVEPLMSSLTDNLQRIEFSVRPSRSYSLFSNRDVGVDAKWTIYSFQLMMSPYFGQQLDIEIPGTQPAIDSIKKLPSVEDKINAVVQLVKNTIQWNNSTSIFADNLATVWTEDKAGGRAEINLAIVNLLRKTGVKCYPLLISTKHHGKTDTHFATLSQFNGVDIMVVDSLAKNNYVFDGTQKYQPYNVPPFNILNRSAYLVDTRNSRWLYIDDPRQLMKNKMTVNASIDSTGIMKGKVSVAYYDYAKEDVLAVKQGKSDTLSNDFLTGDFNDLKIDSVKEENTDTPGKPLIKSFNFKLEMQQTGDFYFLSPFFLSHFKKNRGNGQK